MKSKACLIQRQLTNVMVVDNKEHACIIQYLFVGKNTSCWKYSLLYDSMTYDKNCNSILLMDEVNLYFNIILQFMSSNVARFCACGEWLVVIVRYHDFL